MRKLAVVIFLILTGCAYFPWHPFGTPISAAEKAAKKVQYIRADLLEAVQADIHQACLALAAAPKSRETEVAGDFINEAQALIDQTQGAPGAVKEAKWREMVQGLLSQDAKERAAHEALRARDASRNAETSEQLIKQVAATEKAEAKALQYGQEKAAIADKFLKVWWVLIALAVLWVLSQVLQVAARFNPAFAGASAVLNSVAAPAVSYAFHRAQTGLTKVGEAMGTVRAELPEVAARVRTIFNVATDADHQVVIGAAAEATVGKLLAAKS